jgi:nucleoside-diphosphate-sugar epimerase
MKILIVGANSILSKAIFYQHLADETDVLFHSKPSQEKFTRQFPISELKNRKDEYDFVYIVSAVISSKPEDTKSLFNVNVQLVQQISNQFPNAKLIYFSTVAVYDGLNNVVIDEKTPPSPESIYGISKLWAEKIIAQHKRFCILRISSLFGIGMKHTTFLPLIIDAALSKKKITLAGNGERTQNYISAEDVAVLAKKTALLDENKIQLAISEQNYTNLQVAEIIKNETGCGIAYEGTDTARSVKYAQNTFPYSEYNLTTLAAGIKNLIEWKRIYV